MDVIKINDHFKIKTKIPKPNQEPPASSKAPNMYLEEMEVLCTFKIKIEKIGVSEISNHIQTNKDRPKSSWKPLLSSKDHIKTQRTLMFFANS